MISLLSLSLIAVGLALFPAQIKDNAGKQAGGVMVCTLAGDFDPKKPNEVPGKSVDRKTVPAVHNMEFKICNATYPDTCWTVNSKNSYAYFKLATRKASFTLRLKAKGFVHFK